MKMYTHALHALWVTIAMKVNTFIACYKMFIMNFPHCENAFHFTVVIMHYELITVFVTHHNKETDPARPSLVFNK